MPAAHPKILSLRRRLIVILLMVALCGACTARRPAAIPTPTQMPSPQALVASPLATATSTVAPSATSTQSSTRVPGLAAVRTPTPTVCINDLQVILNLDSAQPAQNPSPALIAPVGGQVQKGWRVQNTGTCTWDTSYVLEFDAPSNPGWINLSPPARLERMVRPGEMVDLYVSALAPPMPGIQQAQWKLVTGSGQIVGQPLAVSIETALLPTGTAAPRAWFSAYPPAVEPGGQVALTWSVQDAKAVYLSTAVQSWENGPVEAAASRFVYPQHTTTYELHIVNGDDSIETVRVRVEVEDYAAPKITTFEIRPRNPFPGECLEITWEVKNRVNFVFIFMNDDMLFYGKDRIGVLRTCPAAGSGSVVYSIKADGLGGEDIRNQPMVIP